MSAIASKERPILFKGEMVRAIRDNRKTQTRRIMKPQPVLSGDRHTWGKTGIFLDAPLLEYKCPYGKPGDRLWVRETWYRGVEKFWYKADIEDLSQCGISGWKPSIHMPRAASRITLEITNVRVERLQDITEEDAIAEGVGRHKDGWKCYSNCSVHADGYDTRTSATASFMSLWNSINGKAYPWESSPWLWIVEFKQIDKAIAAQQSGGAA